MGGLENRQKYADVIQGKDGAKPTVQYALYECMYMWLRRWEVVKVSFQGVFLIGFSVSQRR
jgi:hypothetical protein